MPAGIARDAEDDAARRDSRHLQPCRSRGEIKRGGRRRGRRPDKTNGLIGGRVTLADDHAARGRVDSPHLRIRTGSGCREQHRGGSRIRPDDRARVHTARRVRVDRLGRRVDHSCTRPIERSARIQGERVGHRQGGARLCAHRRDQPVPAVPAEHRTVVRAAHQLGDRSGHHRVLGQLGPVTRRCRRRRDGAERGCGLAGPDGVRRAHREPVRGAVGQPRDRATRGRRGAARRTRRRRRGIARDRGTAFAQRGGRPRNGGRPVTGVRAHRKRRAWQPREGPRVVLVRRCQVRGQCQIALRLHQPSPVVPTTLIGLTAQQRLVQRPHPGVARLVRLVQRVRHRVATRRRCRRHPVVHPVRIAGAVAQQDLLVQVEHPRARVRAADPREVLGRGVE